MDKIIDDENDEENWVDPSEPSGGLCRSSDGINNDDTEGEEDTQGGEKETGKEMGTKDWKGKGIGKSKGKMEAMVEEKGKGKGNGKGKGIVKQTPGGDGISRAVTLQLQKKMYKADWDKEG